MYICNCNGLREKDVRKVIDQGASTPRAVFHHCQTRPQCAKCVCDIRDLISEQQILTAVAAQ